MTLWKQKDPFHGSEIWTLAHCINDGRKEANAVRWLAVSTTVDPPSAWGCITKIPFCFTCELLSPPRYVSLSQHAFQQANLSSQDTHNTLCLMRRWEVHPHRWILFLWPAVDCLPQPPTAGFQHVFLLSLSPPLTNKHFMWFTSIPKGQNVIKQQTPSGC